MEDASLLNISSSYIVKQIFSNIDYNRFISLIKYSKKYQNYLGFNLKNNLHYNKIIEKNIKVNLQTNYNDTSALLSAIPLFAPHYVYFIIYYILNKKFNIKLKNNNKAKKLSWKIENDIIFKRLSIIFYIILIPVLYHIIYRIPRGYPEVSKKYFFDF